MTFPRIFLNELSLLVAPDRESIHRAMIALMDARRASPALLRALYCSRQTAAIEAIEGEQLIASISHLSKDYRTVVLLWLTRNGPFLDDERDEAANDLYHLDEDEVTDFGPGEAARQLQRKNEAALFSFKHRPDRDFTRPVLRIVQGFTDDPIAIVPVTNFSDLSEAAEKAEEGSAEPKSWDELFSFCVDRFDNLVIGPYCLDVLRPLPFYPNVSRRSIELCTVLNRLAAEIQQDGSYSPEGNEIIQNHFIGEKAWFTGESDENKRMFAKEMTFPDPENAEMQIQCFWHGKIKTPQFRIHFEWPLLKNRKKIKIAYMGPKIAKK